ncbi:MAG: glycosyltransferase family A protein [Pseudomonadota bacterium]
MNTPFVTVVMPVFNVERYLAIAMRSVLNQTYTHFELLIIDDGSTDDSCMIAEGFRDARIQIIRQENRGLAGARNTGIRHACGEYIAFLDSDDAWVPGKLAAHVKHLQSHPDVGVSYAGSRLIDDNGRPMGIFQTPKLEGVTAADVFMRNPVGNGSAPVIRRAVFKDIQGPYSADGSPGWFNEHFRQSEDIECWMRIALNTSWRFEGVEGALTDYRINSGGLSANIVRQFETWARMRDIVARNHPAFAARWADLAEAFQLRYLARRAINMRDRGMAISLALQAAKTAPGILIREPAKSAFTVAAALALRLLPPEQFEALQARLRRKRTEPSTQGLRA